MKLILRHDFRSIKFYDVASNTWTYTGEPKYPITAFSLRVLVLDDERRMFL